MDGPAVVALVVVLGNDLPVGIDVVGEAQAQLQIGEWIAPDAVGHGTELVEQRGARRFCDPEPSAPGVGGERCEREVRGINAIGMRRVHQRSIEGVGP